MDALKLIGDLLTDLAADETLDLSNYSERFVEINDAFGGIEAEFEQMRQTLEDNANDITALKDSNWNLSKKITTKDDVEDIDPEGEETLDDEEVEFESIDDAIDDLFEKGDDEDE